MNLSLIYGRHHRAGRCSDRDGSASFSHTKRDAPRAVQEALAAEAAEAHALAQRATEPEAGRQDWLAAEEVAVLDVPEQGVRTSCEGHDHTERDFPPTA